MTIRLSEMTWSEAKNAVDKEAIAIVPLAAFEQHGYHLPLNTDVELVTAVAEGAANKVAESGLPIVVTPTVWTGYSPHHLGFSGTITLSLNTLEKHIMDICRCISKHRFKKIFLLNGHGGNANIIRSVVQALYFEDGIRTVSASYWDFAIPFIKEWRVSDIGGIDHACEMETALMLHLRPDLVKQDKIKDGRWFPYSKYLTGDLAIGGIVATTFDLSEITNIGVVGSPSLATEEKGKELYEHIVNQISDFLEEFNSWDWNKMTVGSLRTE